MQPGAIGAHSHRHDVGVSEADLRKRLRSGAIPISAVVGVSIAVAVGCCGLVSCSPEEDTVADCVEGGSDNGDGLRVVDDDNCNDGYRSGGYGGYYWYYGGDKRGNRVSKGTSVRPKDVDITSRDGKTIQSGGFGGRFSGGGG